MGVKHDDDLAVVTADLLNHSRKQGNDPHRPASLGTVLEVMASAKLDFEKTNDRIDWLKSEVKRLRDDVAHQAKMAMRFYGDWRKDAHYSAGAVVRHAGSLYVCRSDESVYGVTPCPRSGWEPI